MKIKNIIIFGVLLGLILPNFAFAQQIGPPETLEQAKEIAERAGQEIQFNLPDVLKKIWEEETLPIFQKIWSFIKNIWDSYAWPNIKKLWQKITAPFIEEIEKRKPIIEEEFQKEKQVIKEEIKTELPKAGKSLWERFKELIK